MERIQLLAVAFVAASLLFPAGSARSGPVSPGRTKGPIAAVWGSGLEIVDARTGKVRFIGSAPGSPIPRPAGVGTGATAPTLARAFLARRAGAFGIDGEASRLVLSSLDEVSAGRSVVRFQQMYEGIPVVGGELVVNLDRGGNVLSAGGETLPATRISAAPRVSSSVARRTAVAVTGRTRGVPASRLRASKPRLTIYDARLLGGPGPGRPALVWRTDVTSQGHGAVDELVLVDAQRGVVALHFDQIETAVERRVCDARNSSSEVPCTAPVRVEGGPPSAIRDVNGAYELTGATHDFYLRMFGRDSADGAGLPLVATTRYCAAGQRCPWPNAAWSPDLQQVIFGQGFASADDVVAHELTHAVVDHTASLFSYHESGAIAESIADTLAELFDQTNGRGTDTAAVRWLVGEDSPAGAFRDMKHPGRFEQPDRMTSDLYTLDPRNVDQGGVHINSGVGNKAAFLITDGGTFNGRTVRGLGPQKAARIYYEVATSGLTSASDYADLSHALPQACRNLVGTAGITDADCNEVVAAVDAVEMSATRSGDAAVCPGGGTAQNLFFDDLENPTSGNWTPQPAPAASVWHYPQPPERTYATSGRTNFWGSDWSPPGTYSIAMTHSVRIPEAEAVYLHFDHSYAFAYSRGDNITRGLVEYRTDGGEWTDAGPLWDEGGYNARSRAFVRTSNGYGSSRANLGSLAGQNVRFRFTLDVGWAEFAVLPPPEIHGWFIDDVRVYTCSIHPPTTSIDGPSTVVAGRDASWTFTAADPAPDDQAGVLAYRIDWAGDGLADETVSAGSSLPLHHSYPRAGRYRITATAADHHGSEGRPTVRTIVVRSPVQIASSSLVLARNGCVAVEVRSLARSSRTVTVTVRSASRLRAAGKRRYVLLGSVKRRIEAGKTASMRVRLTPEARALVERLGTVKVTVTAVAGDRVTRTLILRAR